MDISTHAPAQGATRRIVCGYAGRIFQPTLPHRERQINPIIISILLSYFNPRSRTGSDSHRHIHYSLVLLFQPTLPHRERRGIPKDDPLISGDFNPRSRTGSDRTPSASGMPAGNFNPRSRTGSDTTRPPPKSEQSDFNPRSRTGSDVRMGGRNQVG